MLPIPTKNRLQEHVGVSCGPTKRYGAVTVARNLNWEGPDGYEPKKTGAPVGLGGGCWV